MNSVSESRWIRFRLMAFSLRQTSSLGSRPSSWRRAGTDSGLSMLILPISLAPECRLDSDRVAVDLAFHEPDKVLRLGASCLAIDHLLAFLLQEAVDVT